MVAATLTAMKEMHNTCPFSITRGSVVYQASHLHNVP